MVELVTRWTERAKKSRERLDICFKCEHYKPETSQCRKCGCFMKAKTLWPSASCPIDKWDPYEEEKKT